MEFTKEQLEKIQELKPDFNGSTYGNKGKLSWQFWSVDGKLSARYEFQARDIDGDWGMAASWRHNLTFEELIEIIEHPNFDTRSWN